MTEQTKQVIHLRPLVITDVRQRNTDLMKTPRFYILRQLSNARRLHLHYWRLACNHDGIPASSLFAAFSSSNPYTDRAGRAALLMTRSARTLLKS